MPLLVVSAVITAAACGGNEDSNKGFVATPTPAPRVSATPDGLPGQAFRSNGNTHITAGGTVGTYFSNPPTSGWHYAETVRPGIYDTPLTAQDIPHFMEHGGVWVLYNCPTACVDLVNQLIPVVNRSTQAGKPVALAPYPKMEKRIAVVAWQRLLTLDAFDEAQVQDFIDKLVCKYNPEGGAPCNVVAGKIEPAVDAATTAGSAPATQTAATPGAQAAGKQYPAAPAMTIDPNKTYTATIATVKGEIKVQLDAKAAPITVNNFVFLARDGFYDGLTFHRVEPNFVIQGGDPAGNGTGGPGYTIKDEKSGLKHDDGALAMAKTSAPDSAGSQFYITIGAQSFLDNNYTVFGKVTSGLDVVRLITRGDRITKITIEEK